MFNLSSVQNFLNAFGYKLEPSLEEVDVMYVMLPPWNFDDILERSLSFVQSLSGGYKESYVTTVAIKLFNPLGTLSAFCNYLAFSKLTLACTLKDFSQQSSQYQSETLTRNGELVNSIISTLYFASCFCAGLWSILSKYAIFIEE